MDFLSAFAGRKYDFYKSCKRLKLLLRDKKALKLCSKAHSAVNGVIFSQAVKMR